MWSKQIFDFESILCPTIFESGKNICNKLYQNAFCFEINQDTLTTSKSDAPQSFEVWFLRRNNYSGSYQVNQNYPKQRKLQLQCGNESNLICAQLSWVENRLLRIHVLFANSGFKMKSHWNQMMPFGCWDVFLASMKTNEKQAEQNYARLQLTAHARTKLGWVGR